MSSLGIKLLTGEDNGTVTDVFIASRWNWFDFIGL